MAIDKTKIQKSAEKLLASGKVAPAIDEYLKILKENPRDFPLMIVIGDLYLKINKTSDAIQYFLKVADHYNADGFFLKAIAIYKRINKLDPNLTEVSVKLADLYLKQGLTMDAKTQLQVVAGHFMSKNQPRDAIQTLKKLIDIEPDNLRSRNELAKAYKNEGMLNEAVQEYLAISDELTRKNLLKESLAVLETAFKLDSRNSSILRKILAVFTEQNEMGKAHALLEDALKADPTNPQVLALLADTYASKNQYDRAHQTIDQAILNTMDKEPFWTIKGDYFLKQGDLLGAYEQYVNVVDRLAKRKELEKAIGVLEKITKVDSSFHPALQKILEFHISLRQEANVISTYNSLVDVYIAKTMYREAESCLQKLIGLESDNSQHQGKLDFVRSFLGKPPMHAEEQKPAAPAPAPVREATPPPEPAQEVGGEDFELDINLDLPPAVEVPAGPVSEETPIVTHPPAPKPAPPTPPPPTAPAASAEGTEEEKEFVSEHLIEAEVFTKYGLIDKAIEQLQIVTGRYPNSVVAHQKLKEIYLEKGDRDRAVEECVLMSRIFRKQGDLDQAEDLLSEARQINPNHPSLDRAYKEMPAAPPAQPPMELQPVPEPVVAEPAPVEVELPEEPAVAAPPPVEPEPVVPPVPVVLQPAAPPEPPAPAPAKPAPPTPVPAPAKPAPPAKPPAPAAKPSAPAASRKDVMGEIEKLAMGIKSRPVTRPAPKPAPPPPPPVQEAVPAPQEIVAAFETPARGGEGGPDRFEEVDFYTSQGLMADAHRLLLQLKEKHPEDPGVLSRLAKFEEVPSPAIEPPVTLAPPEEAISSLDLLNAAIPEVAAQETEPAIEAFGELRGVEPERGAAVSAEVPVEIPELGAEEPVVVEPRIEEPEAIEALIEPEPMVEALPEHVEESVEEPAVSEASEQEVGAISLEGLDLSVPDEILAPEEKEGELAAEMQEVALGEVPAVPAAEAQAPALESALAETMDLSDFGELSVPADLMSDAPTEPGVQMENPFEGTVTEEPVSESLPSAPVEFGEAVEIAENVVETPAVGVKPAEELEFPAERSLDDALDAAFHEETGPAEETATVQASQELFEEEEDFFDLAAELEEGFLNVQNAVEEERPADGQNYSIEEILTDFKKGVEKQLGAEDYDTRYNLGIAYKEMGLVDEAIAEFQIAAKDEKRFLECCSMLGLCFLEKGMPKLALKWYQRGLETPGYSEEEYLGVRFEMAQAYEATGEDDRALECYQDVYGANASYRNVSKKIKDLQQQLKKK